ncbi:MAG TPA: PKD domain-containing protein [Bacteroidia bacterium]|nr:PKD domain-containing protein [Bacteroidia bacterium]HRH07082.1 PKD domain-containing protein [Bacteroidia bacterium]
MISSNKNSRIHCFCSADYLSVFRLRKLQQKALVLGLLFCLAFVGTTKAITYYSRATGNWNANSTWSTVSFVSATNTGTFPVAGDVVNIGGGFIVTVNVNSACSSITYESGVARSNTLTISGSNSLSVSGTITIPRAAGPGTSNINLLAVGSGSLTAATLAYTNTGNSSRHRLTISTGTVTITGNITTNNSGRRGATISFTGAGLLNVGGSLFSGGGGTLTPSTGTVNYNGGGAQTIGTFTYYNLTLTNNSTKSLRANTNLSNILTVNAGATLGLSTFSLGATTAPLSMVLFCAATAAATISGTGTLNLGGNVTVNSAGTGTVGAVITCPISLRATRTFTVADDGTTAKDLTISGIVSGASFGIIKTGVGCMELAALNTYSGTTTISAGILRASNNTVVASTNGAFGNNASGINLNGGTLQNNATTFSRPLTVTASNSTIDAYGSTRTIASNINLATAGTFNLNLGGITATSAEGQVLTLSGVISNSTGTLSLTKIATSTATLSGTSSYTGTTTISGGTLIAGASVSVSTNGPFGNSATAVTLGDVATTISNLSPTLLTGGAFTIARAVTIANQVSSGVYSLGGNTANTSVFSGTITLNQPLTITQIAAGTVQLSGTISTGSNKLTKAGAGTFQRTSSALILGGAFEVSAGTFNANNFASTISGLTSVSGGTYTAGTAAQTFNGGLTVSGGTYTGLSGTAGNTVCTNVLLSSGTLSAPGSTGSFTVSGNWTNNGGTFTHNNGVVNFNGVTQTLVGSTSSTFSTLIISGSSTTTLSINTPITSVLTVNGIYDLSTFTSNRTAAGGTLTISGTLRLGGTSGGQAGSNFPLNFSTLALAGGTVNYNRSNGGQTVYSTPAYATLALSNTTGTQTAGGNISCSILSTTLGGTLDMVTNTLSVSGSPSNAGNILTQNTSATPISNGKNWGGTITFNAAGNQTISNGNYTNLALAVSGNKTFAAALSIFANISISGTAKANLSTFTSSANSLTLGGSNQANGSWGSTSSPATNKNNTWFLSPSTGIINIATSGCVNSSAAVLSGTASICNGNSTNLSVAITGGTPPFSVVYSDGVTSFTVNGYTSGSAIPVTPVATTTYSLVSVTGTGGCVGTGLSGTPTVTVNFGSTAAILSGSTTICTGNSTNLSVAISGGTSPFSVVYSDGTTPSTVNGYTSGSSISVTPSSTKTYSLVSVTSTGGCGGSGLSGTPLVTVNPLAIANAGGNAVACGSNSFTFSAATASNNSGVLWSTAGDGTFNNSGLLASTYTFGASDLLVGSVQITLTALGISPCGNTPNTITLTKSLPGTWLGLISNDWSNAGNWCGGVPTASTNVLIESGAPFYPLISAGNQFAQSIVVESGGSITINGGNLNLAGDITNDGLLSIGAFGTLNMGSNQITGSGQVSISGTYVTSKAAGFSGSASSSISTTISSLIVTDNSTIDYSSAGAQNITAGSYGNITNSGNGDRSFDNTGTIQIAANFSPGSGNYTTTGSTLEFNGTSAQSIPAIAPSSIYASLDINNAAGVSLASSISISDALFLTNGNLITTGFNFTLLSSATTTARIAPVVNGGLVGNITMQRFITGGNSGWVTMGMPVSGATLAEWCDDIVTSGFTGSTTGTGTFISIYGYDETVGGLLDAVATYIPATNSADAVDPFKGYFVFVADNASTVADKLISVTGPPLLDDQDLGVTYTNNLNVSNDGWNLVNNPYASAIDWGSPNWTKTNMDDAVYIYDTDNSQYVGSVGGVSFNGGSEIIASSQSFFVHANSLAPELIITEDCKANNSPAFYKSGNPLPLNLLRMELSGLGGIYKDEAVLQLKQGASTNFDPAFDAYKLYSFDYAAPNICSKLNGVEYVVNTFEMPLNNMQVDVKVKVNTAGNYTLNFKGLNSFKSFKCLVFEDKLTGNKVDLLSDSSYSFYSGIDTVSAYSRFILHLAVEELKAYFEVSDTLLHYPGNTSVQFTNNSLGALSYSWDFGDGSFIDSSSNPVHTFLQPGNYSVVLTCSNLAGCISTAQQNIRVDNVTAQTTLPASEQFSVSVEGTTCKITFDVNGSKAVQFRLFTSTGKQVGNAIAKTLHQSGYVQLNWPTISKGIYTLEITNGNIKQHYKLKL